MKTLTQEEDDGDRDQEEHRKKIFYETRGVYVSLKYDQSILKDKHLLTLSAAALGLSITYIDKIVTLAEARCILLLILSWILFGLSLVSIIFSYHHSVPCYDHYIKEMDSKFEAGEDFQDINCDLDVTIDNWNSCAVWFFLFGLVFFIAFVIINTVIKAHA